MSSVLDAKAVEVEDDTGRTIRVNGPAMRIIALYGAYNEMLDALGLESRLVGRTKIDRLPSSILSRPSIGTHMRPNVELVLALKPDLILQGGGRREAMLPVNQLRSEGLNVAVFSPTTFAELFTVIEKLGILTGETAAAGKLVNRMRQRLATVQSKVDQSAHRPKIFFEVRFPNLLAAGGKSIVNEVIERAGGCNCVTVDKKMVRVNMESLIACNPDFYIIQKGPMNPEPGPPAERPNFLVLNAVQEGRVHMVDEQVFSRPGPRSVDAVEELYRLLHPAAEPGNHNKGESP